MRKCKECSAVIPASRHFNVQYCTKACRVRTVLRRVQHDRAVPDAKECDTCHKAMPQRKQKGGNAKRFCSAECRLVASGQCTYKNRELILCVHCGGEFPERQTTGPYRKFCSDACASTSYHNQHPIRGMLSTAKVRAKKAGVPFCLVEKDIVIPTHCPILGIPLFRGKGKAGTRGNSPSIDRMVPKLGYVKGNVYMISHRANALKSDATIEQIEALLSYMRNGVQCVT